MTDFTPEHYAILEAAIDLAEAQHGLDLGMPAQAMHKRAFKSLMDACADLAAENDGTMPLPDPETTMPTTRARGMQQPTNFLTRCHESIARGELPEGVTSINMDNEQEFYDAIANAIDEH